MKTTLSPELAVHWHHQESIQNFPVLTPWPSTEIRMSEVCQGWEVWKAPQVPLIYSQGEKH